MLDNDKKRERFLRLASYRTNEVLKKLNVLGHCSNKSAYKYTNEEINKIFIEIERKVKEIKSRFSATAKNNKEFKL